tara:strand:+ start:309 stop:1472 length:1164 start_codon:yes stop_codon:yes gene_type:complete
MKEILDMNKIKDVQQRKALNCWANAGFKGSIIAGTGFGKSRCGILAIDYALRTGTKALILVPTIQLQDQFREEFYKWDLGHCLDNVEVLCYQSAYKLQNEHYSIVVCDEIHLGLSKEYKKFFDNNTYDKLLCMTATVPEEQEYASYLNKLAPTVYKVTLDQCVKLGLVSPYKIQCIPVELTTDERAAYKAINNQFIRSKYVLGQFDAFSRAKYIMSTPDATPEDRRAAAQFYQSIRERKAIIDFAENKVKMFKDLVINNLDKKILAFSGANDFTDQLAASVSPLAMAYHSGKTKKQREIILDAFKNDTVKVLCSTKALNQGLDVPDANMGIMCGITSKALPMIQRVGRLVRFKEGKTGNIIILYVKDSQEEKWLKNSTKNLDNVNWM